jgi:hypothetical protein
MSSPDHAKYRTVARVRPLTTDFGRGGEAKPRHPDGVDEVGGTQ